MIKYISKIQHSLISKLIVSVGLMLLLSLATWAYMNTNYQKKKFMADIISNTDLSLIHI
jgi:histidine kinase